MTTPIRHPAPTPDTLTKLFVYGTLKRGYPLYRRLHGAKYIGTGSITGYYMAHLQLCPAAVVAGNSNTSVLGEVFELPFKTLWEIDQVEQGYTRMLDRVFGHGDVWVYVMPISALGIPFARIMAGIWHGPDTSYVNYTPKGAGEPSIEYLPAPKQTRLPVPAADASPLPNVLQLPPPAKKSKEWDAGDILGYVSDKAPLIVKEVKASS